LQEYLRRKEEKIYIWILRICKNTYEEKKKKYISLSVVIIVILRQKKFFATDFVDGIIEIG
jgi:hypothetical protein